MFVVVFGVGVAAAIVEVLLVTILFGIVAFAIAKTALISLQAQKCVALFCHLKATGTAILNPSPNVVSRTTSVLMALGVEC